jgi:hypothetical protein
MEYIEYRGGYKYQLKKTYKAQIEIAPSISIYTQFIILDANGLLEIRNGYAWDGPSGPTIDTRTFMRGSLVHDALYQLIREDKLSIDSHREVADRILRRICLEDGMNSVRAWGVYHAVRRFGDPSADPDKKRPTTKAPKECEGET